MQHSAKIKDKGSSKNSYSAESQPTSSFPLSYNQRSIWLQHILAPDSVANNIAQAIQLQNEIDLVIFKRTLQKITDRHPALRTTFTVVKEQPIQLVHEHQAVFFQHEDASEWDDITLNQRISDEVYRLFDLENGPLFRAFLFSKTANDHVLLLTMHHIITDMWSVALFLKDFATIYQNELSGKGKPLPTLKTTYFDYVTAQQNLLNGPEGERLQTYWKRQLSGELPVLNLPTDRPRQAAKTHYGGAHPLPLGPSLTNALKEISNIHNVTLFSVVLAAFQVFLSRYSGQDDILVSTPKAGRSLKTARLLGYFINPVFLRANLSGDPSFATFLQQVHQTVKDAFDHDAYPFQKLLEDFQLSRELKTKPFLQVTFAWQKSMTLGDKWSVTSGAVGNSDSHTLFKGFAATPIPPIERVSPYELSLLVGDVGDELIVTFAYKRDLFDATTITRMASHFETLLYGIAANPDQSVATLPLLTETERQQVLVEWNDTAVTPPPTCLHHLFEAQAAKTPHAIALTFEGTRLTYETLNQKANQLAHYLRQKHQVQPGVLVAIQLERSLEMIIGILGILKAGGAYIPLDPIYPPTRLAHILEDTKACLLVTRSGLSNNLPPFNGTIIDMDSAQDLWSTQPATNPDKITTPDDLAYIVYTSGSTGKPKGVLAHHRGVAHHLTFLSNNYNINEKDIVIQLPTISFDASVRDIFTPLISGAQVVIINSDDLSHPPAIVAKMKEHAVTCILSIVPSLLRPLLAAAESNWQNKSLRLLLTSGEALSMSSCRRAKEIFGADLELINQYGPTECTMTSTFYRIEDMDDERAYALIGRPIANTQIYLLDKQLNPVPVGVPGEIHIGGIELSYGYLNQPKLTTQKFIVNPFADKPDARLYKTGDLARYLPDGTLEFIGRIDNQVKLRGYRVELGEIEAALNQHPALQQAVVVAPEITPDERQLVAYLLANDNDLADTKSPDITTDSLRTHLRNLLPMYMIPTSFIFVDQMPLTPNGKIDRKALLAYELDVQGAATSKYIPPTTPLEIEIAAIWQDVLNLPQIGNYDNFFELGGHSLLATQIVSRIRESMQVDLPIRAIFEEPTVAELAKRVITLQSNSIPLPQSPIIRVNREDNLPLSFSQERMWFLYQLDPEGTAYSIPGAVLLKGPLDKEALEWSINQIIIRHESLRTWFTAVTGQPTAIIEPIYTFTLPFEDFRGLPKPQRKTHVNNLMETAAQTPFQLDQLPLLQMKLFQLDDEEHILFVNIHHIISDQWSAGVLSRDLAAYYQAHQSNQPANLPEMSIQSVDHAAWQRQLAADGTFDAQADYWKKQLEGMTTLDLLTDRPRPTILTTNGAILNATQPAWLTDSLQKLSQQENVSPFMVLLAVFKLLLSRYTGVEDIVVGSPIANRHQLQSEILISTLVNTLVLRTDLSGNPTFRQLLQRVKKMALDAYAHQDIPFERLVKELQPARDTSRSPLFQIFFNVQNAPFSLPDLPHVESKVIEIDRGAAQFDLSLSIDTAVTHQATLEYNTNLFDADRMEQMMGHYWSLLETAVHYPDRHLSDLPLLTDAEIAQLDAWNDTAVPYQRNACLHHLFEAQVEKTPQDTAVTFEGQSLTYQQLNQRANQLARHLQNLGIGSGSLIGINLERSLEMIVALFAVHKTGAAYIPLDPAFPQDRLDFMLADSQAQVLITQTNLLATRTDEADLQYVCVDRDTAVIDQYDNHNLPHSATATDLAYIIYTSGSTGKPKGVQIEHRSAVNFLNAMSHQPGLTADDVLLSVTTVSFDIAVLEIFLPLINGAQIELVSRETAVNAAKLQSTLTQSGASIMQATPTTWRMLIEAGWSGDSHLKVLCGGEAMPRDLADQLLPRCNQLWNMYGPTETTVWSSVYHVQPGNGPILIGRPIDNTTFYILDKEQRPLPVGVPGELYIGGDGLARGYLNRPELTAEKFIANPIDDFRLTTHVEQSRNIDDSPAINRQSPTVNHKLYRTGDQARFLPDGSVEFFGRIDNQVKVRGYRIELGEIESVLANHPALREVVVTTQEINSGDKRLVAYFIPESTVPSADDLRTFARVSLPDYMIPSAFVAMESFPLTPNKKIDRQALPAPQTIEQATTAEFAAPQDALEIQLTRIWQNILGISGIGRHDNFFELGGHSLLAVRVFSQIEQITQIDFPLTTLFRAPTIAQLANVLRSEGVQTRWTSLVPVQPKGSRPIFFHVAPFLVSVLSFSELARHLGNDQPLYGLQPQGVDGNAPHHKRVEDMAAHYIEEIRSLQPEGPYMLGGHCAGNWVAFEMAQQLQAQGEEVSLLVLVDSEPPNIAPPRIHPIKYFASRITFYWKGGRLWDALTWKLGLAYQHFIILRMGEENARRIATIHKAHAYAHRQYRSGTFDGDIVLIRSHESATLRDKDWHLRWSELITGNLQHEEVPGTHAGLLVEPSASKMAAKIRAAIDKVLAENK